MACFVIAPFLYSILVAMAKYSAVKPCQAGNCLLWGAANEAGGRDMDVLAEHCYAITGHRA